VKSFEAIKNFDSFLISFIPIEKEKEFEE